MCLQAIITGTVLLVSFLSIMSRLDRALAPMATFVGGILSATVVTPPLLSLQESGIFAMLIMVVVISAIFGHWEGKLTFKRASLSFFGFSLFAGLLAVLYRMDPTSIESLLIFGDMITDGMHALGFECNFYDQFMPR